MTPADTPQQLVQLRAALARSQEQLAGLVTVQEELLHAVAHDLRAPLRHVGSYGALVRELLQTLPPEVLQSTAVQEALGFLGTMEHSARRLGLMLAGLQALLHASQAALRTEAVALPLALARARTHPAVAAAEAGRAIAWQVDAELPTLHADPEWLQELLVQLLDNALKFTRLVAQPHITVQAAPAAPDRLAFTVQDNGAGFDPARAGMLFGIFQRLHRETAFEGVGTGLALCRAIAQRHGGSITTDAPPAGGCTVRVEWPAAVNAPPTRPRPPYDAQE